MLELKESISEWKSMPSLLKIDEASSSTTGALLARDSSPDLMFPTQTVDGHNDRLSPTFECSMLPNYKSCIPPSRARRNSSPRLPADTLSVKCPTSTLSILQPTKSNTPFILCSLTMLS